MPNGHRPPVPTLPRSEQVVDALPHGIAVLDDRGVVITTNRLWDLAVIDDDPLVQPRGTSLPLALHGRGPIPAVAEHLADGLARLLDGRGRSFQVQYQVPASDDLGDPRWFLAAAEALDSGGLVVTRTETTVHHGVNEVLAELAFHDDLTGLPNRGLLLDRLRMALIRAPRQGLWPLVVFADLDGFKAVNDVHGHDVGDLVLVEAARRLSHAVRGADTCGRWGGDEFVLVVELGDAAAVDAVIERMQAAVEPPFVLPDGTRHRLGLSIGAVLAEGHERVETLIARADAAMYEAKRTGQGAVVVGRQRDRP